MIYIVLVINIETKIVLIPAIVAFTYHITAQWNANDFALSLPVSRWD